jgi:hypothetical protein
VNVLHNMVKAVRPGGAILDLQVIRPTPRVELSGELICEIDGRPLFEKADAAANAVEPMIARVASSRRRSTITTSASTIRTAPTSSTTSKTRRGVSPRRHYLDYTRSRSHSWSANAAASGASPSCKTPVERAFERTARRLKIVIITTNGPAWIRTPLLVVAFPRRGRHGGRHHPGMSDRKRASDVASRPLRSG